MCKKILTVYGTIFSFLIVPHLFSGCKKETVNSPESNHLEVDYSTELHDSNSKLQWDDNLLLYDGKGFTGTITSTDQELGYSYKSQFFKGLKHGKEWAHYGSGKKRHMKTFEYGHEDGAQQMWFESGKLFHAYHMELGEKHGDETIYFANGSKRAQKKYKSGQEAFAQYFALNGDLIANYIVKDGRKYGRELSSGCITLIQEPEETEQEKIKTSQDSLN